MKAKLHLKRRPPIFVEAAAIGFAPAASAPATAGLGDAAAVMNALAGGCTFLVIALIAAALRDCNTGYTPSKSRDAPVVAMSMSMWPVWPLLIWLARSAPSLAWPHSPARSKVTDTAS